MKKINILFMAISLVALVGCATPTSESLSDNVVTPDETQWYFDETSHWHLTDERTVSTVDLAEHTFGDWEVVEEPTCTENGTSKRTCTVCGYSETREDESLGGHTLSADYTVINAGCADYYDFGYLDSNELAVIERTCEVCGETVTEEIDCNNIGCIAFERYATGTDKNKRLWLYNDDDGNKVYATYDHAVNDTTNKKHDYYYTHTKDNVNYEIHVHTMYTTKNNKVYDSVQGLTIYVK